MQIEIPDKVKYIIHQLMNHGYESYAVGGCIRDSLLMKSPDDWDITTSAKAMEIKKIFSRTVDTGIQHGTVTVLLDEESFEVTTYRIDGEYEDSRRPKAVMFTHELAEDLKRRDFTINAMAYNPQEGLIDLFGGMDDLKRKVIRCVGKPLERFNEDALRMLRAIRISAQLDFRIEEETKQSIFALNGNLSHISAERIQAELVKLLVSPHPGTFRIAYETGITKVILPEFDDMMETACHDCDGKYYPGERVLIGLSLVEPDKALRFTMLLHDIAEPIEGEKISEGILRRLRFDNDTIHKVTKLIRWHDEPIYPSPEAVRKTVCKMGEELFPLLLKVKRAVIQSWNNSAQRERLACLDEVEQVYDKIVKEGQCVSLKTLAVTGSDLISVGMKPGEKLGEELLRLLELVLENPQHNKKEYLLEQIKL